jgi:hypothetical protein
MLPHHDQQASQDRNQMQHVQELCPAYTFPGHVLQVQSERLFQQPPLLSPTGRYPPNIDALLVRDCTPALFP